MAATEEQVEEQVNGEESRSQATPSKKESASTTILLMVLLLMAILSIPLIFMRLNVMDAGEKVRPYLKSNSFLKFALPPQKNPDDLNTMNREELIKLNSDLKSKLASAEEQLKKSNKIADIYTGSPDGFNKFDADRAEVKAKKEQMEKDKEQLQKDKAAFYEQVKNSDTASFKQYYEKMDAQTAQRIYTEIMKQEKVSNEIKDFVDYYQKMDPASSAKIFDQLSITKIDLVADILRYMDKGKASKILQAMDVKVAGRITDILAKKSPLGN